MRLILIFFLKFRSREEIENGKATATLGRAGLIGKKICWITATLATAERLRNKIRCLKSESLGFWCLIWQAIHCQESEDIGTQQTILKSTRKLNSHAINGKNQKVLSLIHWANLWSTQAKPIALHCIKLQSAQITLALQKYSFFFAKERWSER